jgi:hypothetical protein
VKVGTRESKAQNLFAIKIIAIKAINAPAIG